MPDDQIQPLQRVPPVQGFQRLDPYPIVLFLREDPRVKLEPVGSQQLDLLCYAIKELVLPICQIDGQSAGPVLDGILDARYDSVCPRRRSRGGERFQDGKFDCTSGVGSGVAGFKRWTIRVVRLVVPLYMTSRKYAGLNGWFGFRGGRVDLFDLLKTNRRVAHDVSTYREAGLAYARCPCEPLPLCSPSQPSFLDKTIARCDSKDLYRKDFASVPQVYQVWVDAPGCFGRDQVSYYPATDGIFERKPSAATRAVKVSAGWPCPATGERLSSCCSPISRRHVVVHDPGRRSIFSR